VWRNFNPTASHIMSIFRVYGDRPATAMIRLTDHLMGRRLNRGNAIPIGQTAYQAGRAAEWLPSIDRGSQFNTNDHRQPRLLARTVSRS